MKMLFYKGNSQVSTIVFVFRAAFMMQWFLLTLSQITGLVSGGDTTSVL